MTALTAFISLFLTVSLPDADSLLVMFWNLENFFDTKDRGGGQSDKEFSPSGSRHWTRRKFDSKCDGISKGLLWIADKYGRIPDVIGVCEVENRGVLYSLTDNTLLRKFGYEIVHCESGDSRGIDVALMYRKSSFVYVSSSAVTPVLDGMKLKTRDILEVGLRREDRIYRFIVNHHPSKYGGSNASDLRRHAVMKALCDVCDSLSSLSDSSVTVAMGDFNDTPSGSQFSMIESRLDNKSLPMFSSGEGTIRFKGRWDLIDMFLVSPIISSKTRMEIVRIPFLMVWDNSYPGFKPYRTYSGPRYVGGISDHCPIVLKIAE